MIAAHHDNFIREHFVGYKDKNDRRIFCGDILKIMVRRFGYGPEGQRIYTNTNHVKFPVKAWLSPNICLEYDRKEIDNLSKPMGREKYSQNIEKLSEIKYINKEDMEIIGNIHENPELLEGINE